ncbi:LLM class flavin-dependent oxidoreductase [Cellulomonas xiejunii]|uniref:LLM class flavin-dependent oxidoreductase n=1 Tax=Cellulomonas xiejunii TaxID=2968083 RepID=A0ABY5KRL2_9CELL|nr:LLM class flavin-dependent oxidoreductase [Cellulomonas xiejunii]MCC2321240.1 LLM class flavin-dependent oxidoreductase [Cellulomonas xiejunii]UUI71827.1 LLM class flavin-dependent oxidoreductase [Cellulomonas xiejunii]
MTGRPTDLTVFGTCPASTPEGGRDYLDRVAQVASWSDAAGHDGILIYTDNRSVDPWLVAQVVIQATARLAPLVAVQSAYMHPFTAAKLVNDLAYLHGRRVDLNIVAGGFVGDLVAMGEALPHDARYDRAVEYATIMTALFTSREAVTFDGAYYSVTGLRLTPALPAELVPRLLVSGSSPAGLAAARALSATAMVYPQQPEQQPPADPALTQGMRIGVIARPTAVEAWEVALGRFPEDRAGRVTHRLAMSRSDSRWHQQLSQAVEKQGTYWMAPFKSYKTFCPYFVGDYATVGEEIGRYVDAGYTTFILDTPAEEQDLKHTAVVLDMARSRLGGRS